MFYGISDVLLFSVKKGKKDRKRGSLYIPIHDKIMQRISNKRLKIAIVVEQSRLIHVAKCQGLFFLPFCIGQGLKCIS